MKVIFTVVVLLMLISTLRAEQGEDWFIGPRVGFVSPFTGLVGIEAQRKHFSLSAGMPGTYGAKYYFSFPKHSWYVGLYMVRYHYTPVSVKYSDHVYPYATKTIRRNGIWGGYR